MTEFEWYRRRDFGPRNARHLEMDPFDRQLERAQYQYDMQTPEDYEIKTEDDIVIDPNDDEEEMDCE